MRPQLKTSTPGARPTGPQARWMCTLALLGPLLVPSGSAAALPIEHWETSRGARVYFMQSRDLPMLDVSVDFPAGSGRDSPDKAGLASLTQRLMRLGANGMDENDIARRVADVGANMSPAFDLDRAGYALRTLSSEVEQRQALAVLASVLQAPAFPDAALGREKTRVIAGLKESDTKPESIAVRTFMELVFQHHPYGLRSSGEPATVAALTRDDAVSFYRTHYNAGWAVVTIVGDATRERADQIAEQLTRELPHVSAPLAPLPPVSPLAAAVEREIDHPSAQAHILIGQPGLERNDPDYFPLWVGNYVLGGGGFSSRLSEQVRQKRGLAYTVYSYFMPYQRPGPFQIGLQTRADQAQMALSVVREVVREFVATGPRASELEAAKQNIVGGFALRIDTNRKIHDYLRVIGFYGLPLDYLDTFSAKVEAVTIEQIRDAFARRVQPDRMVTVVVGAKATP
ncbi:MAG TPA: pitrilysin family protein [Burkholderiales bacterium]|nr:pitrilysin family protein [Burkholderiales bacterium]